MTADPGHGESWRDRQLAWLEYIRAQLRGDPTVLPPVDVTREQTTFEEEF